ncbi:MAG: tRNA (5-methylaminomethyl-2-thiouridine)(34)-methyltransferase MnmD [Mangrovibacterium sp.]
MAKFAPMEHDLQRRLMLTEDGSHTIYVPELEEHYHSVHGAVQESVHVFIQNGLQRCQKQKLTILEAGFGTGLNALLSLAGRGKRDIHYISLEKYPLDESEYSRLNYSRFVPGTTQEQFLQLHLSAWNKPVEIVKGFRLYKLKTDLTKTNLSSLAPVDLIYYDAFSPRKQPEMWEETLFRKIAACTADEGIFATYCAQGEVRRRLNRSGFRMQRLAGPPGKKEMLFGEKSGSARFC